MRQVTSLLLFVAGCRYRECSGARRAPFGDFFRFRRQPEFLSRHPGQCDLFRPARVSVLR